MNLSEGLRAVFNDALSVETPAVMAARMGVDPSTLSRISNGQTSALTVLSRIAEAVQAEEVVVMAMAIRRTGVTLCDLDDVIDRREHRARMAKAAKMECEDE